MAWKIRPAHFNLRFVRAVRKALAKGEDCCGLVAETYHLFVSASDTEHSALYTVCLVQDDEGTCMAICREVPEVLVFENSKTEAIAGAHAAIEEALAARSSCAEFQRPARPAARSGPSVLHQRLA